MLLPALMVCIALLVQPACLLYTRCVMQSAAAETCRAVATRPDASERNDSVYVEYAKRRLKAVPAIPCFRSGDWSIAVEGGSGAATAAVRISTTVRPLPLLGVVPALLGATDERGDVLVEVEVSRATRPGWVEGSYGGWVGIWD